MHEQVALLRKLLSHIFKHYAEVPDNGYISDKVIEQYPEIFMPRPCIMPIGLQESALLQQMDTPLKSPHHKTEQRFKQDLCHIRRVLFPPETKPEDEPMPLDDINLEDKNVYIPNDFGLVQRTLHWTDTCAFMMNTRTDVNILDCHPVQIP